MGVWLPQGVPPALLPKALEKMANLANSTVNLQTCAPLIPLAGLRCWLFIAGQISHDISLKAGLVPVEKCQNECQLCFHLYIFSSFSSDRLWLYRRAVFSAEGLNIHNVLLHRGFSSINQRCFQSRSGMFINATHLKNIQHRPSFRDVCCGWIFIRPLHTHTHLP